MTINKQTVTCSECRHFIWPDVKYEKNSFGDCRHLKKLDDKFFLGKPPIHKYNEAFRALGNKVFMPYIERRCSKFEGAL